MAVTPGHESSRIKGKAEAHRRYLKRNQLSAEANHKLRFMRQIQVFTFVPQVECAGVYHKVRSTTKVAAKQTRYLMMSAAIATGISHRIGR